MIGRIVMTGMVLALVLGCARKPPRPASGPGDAAAAPTPKSTAAPSAGTEKKTEKPSWLTDPRFKKDGEAAPPGQPGTAGVPPRPPVPAPPPSGAQPPRPALRPVAEADMKEVWIFIENRSGATGRMPRSADVLLALSQANANAAGLVLDGSITLTGATVRESIWAFETKGLSQGGWAATHNGVENLSAGELRRRLGR